MPVASEESMFAKSAVPVAAGCPAFVVVAFVTVTMSTHSVLPDAVRYI
jgi:hypothetical protein